MRKACLTPPTYQNPELIQKFKDALKIDNRAYNLDSVGFYMLFLAIDDLINKLIANRNICETWQKVIKPERLTKLSKQLNIFEIILAEQIDFKTLSANQLKVIALELAGGDCDPRAIIKRDNLVRWVDRHTKAIVDISFKINQVENEINQLKHSNAVYMVDNKGDLKPFGVDFNLLFKQINQQLEANNLTPLSQVKLNRLLLADEVVPLDV